MSATFYRRPFEDKSASSNLHFSAAFNGFYRFSLQRLTTNLTAPTVWGSCAPSSTLLSEGRRSPSRPLRPANRSEELFMPNHDRSSIQPLEG